MVIALTRGEAERRRWKRALSKISPIWAAWTSARTVTAAISSALGHRWTNSAKLRNDVLNSGFRKNPRTAQQIAEDTRRVIKELKAIAAEWKLEEEKA